MLTHRLQSSYRIYYSSTKEHSQFCHRNTQMYILCAHGCNYNKSRLLHAARNQITRHNHLVTEWLRPSFTFQNSRNIFMFFEFGVFFKQKLWQSRSHLCVAYEIWFVHMCEKIFLILIQTSITFDPLFFSIRIHFCCILFHLFLRLSDTTKHFEAHWNCVQAKNSKKGKTEKFSQVVNSAKPRPKK